MNKRSVLGFLTILLCALIVSGQKGMKVNKDEECKDEVVMSAMNEFYKVDDCLKEAGVENLKDLTDNKDKQACYSKCINLKKNLVGEDGKIMKENIGSSLSPSLPEGVKNKIQMSMEKCYDDNGSTIKVEDCNSFMNVSQCIANAFTDVCKA